MRFFLFSLSPLSFLFVSLPFCSLVWGGVLDETTGKQPVPQLNFEASGIYCVGLICKHYDRTCTKENVTSVHNLTNRSAHDSYFSSRPPKWTKNASRPPDLEINKKEKRGGSYEIILKIASFERNLRMTSPNDAFYSKFSV